VSGIGKEQGRLPLRHEISDQYKWKLELIYADDRLWEEDFRTTRSLLPRIAEYRGTLALSPEVLLQALTLRDEIEILLEKLYVYAKMRKDEDNTREKYQELVDRAQGLAAEIGGALSFIGPEILSLDEKTLTSFAQSADLSLYRHHLEEITRLKEHILSEKEEEILSLASEVLQTPENLYVMLSSADLTFPQIRDENGDKTALTHGRFIRFLQSPDRRVRRDAFNGILSSFHGLRNTFNAALSAEVKKNLFLSRARRYGSALEYYQDRDHIPPRVYHNVVDTVNRNLSPLHRYTALKKKALSLKKVHFYDLYRPLTVVPEKNYTFEEAGEIVLKSLQPLGQEYMRIVEEGLAGGWVDVYENKGKTPGGYSYGAYGSPPYILMNFTGALEDLFTLAHEVGHSMHSYYSRKEQPFVYAAYTLFSAEVASTTNETLLVDYLLQAAPTVEKEAIVNRYLEGIRTTFYRQALFAEFELYIHSLVEKGEALTADKLCAHWLELNKRYYGPHFAADDLLGMEWARIPHFYYHFYVYKYVTGFAAGTYLGHSLLGGTNESRGRYIDFLKKGSSGYTLDILKEAGVDMGSPAPLEETVALFSRLIDEVEPVLP
jgi:oligoendopeptidase F